MAQEQILVVTEQWPPYNYTDKNGKIIGSATRKLKQVLDHAGISYEIQMLAWSKAYYLAKARPNVLIYTIYRSAERESQFQWVCPLIETKGLNVYKLASRTDIEISSLDDLKKYHLAVVKDDVSYEFLLNNGFELKRHLNVASSEEANVRLLFNGRVDLLMQEEAALRVRTAKAGYDFSQMKDVLTLFPEDSQKCAAFSLHTKPEVVERVKKSLQQISTQHAK